MDLPQPTGPLTRSSQFKFNSERSFLILLILMLLGPMARPSWGSTPTEPEPPPSEAKRLERALDEALNALATGMQTLVGLAEQSKDKWERCRSGGSKEEWCLKMKDALARLERLGGKEPTDAPKSKSEPPSSNPADPEETAPGASR